MKYCNERFNAPVCMHIPLDEAWFIVRLGEATHFLNGRDIWEPRSHLMLLYRAILEGKQATKKQVNKNFKLDCLLYPMLVFLPFVQQKSFSPQRLN